MTCKIEGCNKKRYARGWCKMHYYRWRNNGHPEIVQQIRGDERYDSFGNKLCTRCRFYLDPKLFGEGKTWCNECRKLSRYKMTKDDYAGLLASQGGVCPICQTRTPEVIDHDHRCCQDRYTCGTCVRGILCRQCNAAMGVLTDEGIHRAANYIGGKRS
jgi:hypothetical protein